MMVNEREQLRGEVSRYQPQLIFSGNATLDRFTPNDPQILFGSEYDQFLTIPLRIRVFDLPSFYVFSAQAQGAFYGQRLLDLLTLARPRDPYEKIAKGSIAGVMNDWELPDLPESERGTRLISLHQRLKAKWDNFISGDRKEFMMALTVTHPEKQQVFLRAQAQKFIGKTQVEARVQKALTTLRTSKFEVKAVNSVVSIDQIPFGRLSKKTRSTLEENARSSVLRAFTAVVDPQDQAGCLFREFNNEYGRVTISHQGKGDVMVECSGSWVVFNTRNDENEELASLIKSPEELAITPHILWAFSKDTRQRYYLMSDVPDSMLDGVDPRSNSRLGLMLACALSPKQRDRIPARIALVKGGRKQPMMEAQVPLLVDMFDGLIVRSELFKNMEISTGIPDLNLLKPQTLAQKLREGMEERKYQLFRSLREAQRMAIRIGVYSGFFGAILGGLLASGGIGDWGGSAVQIEDEVKKTYPTISQEQLDSALPATLDILRNYGNALKRGEQSLPLSQIDLGQTVEKIDTMVSDLENPIHRERLQAKLWSERELDLGVFKTQRSLAAVIGGMTLFIVSGAGFLWLGNKEWGR